MKYKDLEKELKELRESYKTQPSKKIEKRGVEVKKLLAENFGCYECDLLCPKTQIPFMFCDKTCNELWADKHYNANKYTRNMTVEEMQRKLKQFGKEAAQRGFKH